jgi:hypothetical protein
MRLPLTFVLTLLLDDQNPGLFHGRVRSVATDDEITFSGPDELVALLRSEIVQVKPEPAPDSSAPDGLAK